MAGDPANKPDSVRRAVLCLWLSVGLVLFLTVAAFFAPLGIPHDGVTTVTNLASAALLAWVAVKLDAGRGWAQWLFAAIYVLGLSTFVVSMLLSPETFRSLPILLQASGIVQLALQTAALVFMFTATSQRWLRPSSDKVDSST